jgi:Glucose / Sorbosone dehydrogenase
MRVLLTVGVLLAFAAPASAAPALVPLGSFDQPTYATGPPGDDSRVFVTERSGRVRLLVNGAVQATPFLDLSAITQTDYEERGLLSIAFPPDYAASGRFYVYLTARAPPGATDGEIEVRAYQRSAANPNVADPSSGRVLLAIPHTDNKNHDGGQLQFGPDGKLYLGTGDGGGANDQYHHSQDPNSLLGKLIRLDVSQPSPAPEVVARGLRNPWRFSFAPDGRIVIGDVGQDNVEEVDVGLAANYGWPCLEGTRPNVSDAGCAGGGTAPPVLQHSHSGDGFCSITGGYVVRDPALPTLAGRYLYGDFCQGGLRSVDLANPASDAATGLNVAQLSSFGEDACGRILVLSLAGSVFRLVDGAPSPCPAGTTTPPPPPPDTRACKIGVRVTGIRSVRKRHYLTLALRSDESCTATATAKIKHVATFKTVKKKKLTAGGRTVLKLKLTKKGRAAVRRAFHRHKRLRVAVRVRAVDAAGNVSGYTRGIHISG